jgi:hypothetical protein
MRWEGSDSPTATVDGAPDAVASTLGHYEFTLAPLLMMLSRAPTDLSKDARGWSP